MDAEDDECAAARAEAAADGPPGAVPIPGNILHVHTYDRPKNSGKLVGCTCMTCVLLVRYLPAGLGEKRFSTATLTSIG